MFDGKVQICVLLLILSINLRLVYSATVVQLSAIKIGTDTNPEENGEYFEGDMIMPSDTSESEGSTEGMRSRAGLASSKARWPNGVIPYKIDSKYPRTLRTLLSQAMRHISDRTCIKFKARSSEKDYIYVEEDRGCYSYVGRVGGNQTVSLPTQCRSLGTFVHELVHAIGFVHEQSRTDRDDYVKINWNNISPGKQSNFEKYDNSKINPFGVQYDYSSIMHYSSRAFSKGTGLTIVPRKSGVVIGQRRGMSQSDIKKVNNMYCPSK